MRTQAGVRAKKTVPTNLTRKLEKPLIGCFAFVARRDYPLKSTSKRVF
jgi:hypothetical protein